MPEELKKTIFTLEDKIEGESLTLENIGIPMLREFIEEIETLINGDSRTANLAHSRIGLESGSVVIKTMLLAFVADGLERDLTKLAASKNLDEIPGTRARVITRWQEHSAKHPNRFYHVALPMTRFDLRVTATSDFQHRNENFWVSTRKYLTGEISGVGGKQEANLHLVLADGETLKIDMSREQVLGDETNPVYRKRTVYVQAEQHISTKILRNAKLIQFVKAPKVDPDDARLLTELWERGGKAWADVRSPGDWVEELRGNT